MNRNWTGLLAAVGLMLVGLGAGPASPAARVLEVKGKATVVEGDSFDRPAAVYGTIYVDERLVVAKDSQVTLVFRNDGHVERVVAPGTFQVTASGCQPPSGVQQVSMPEQNRAVVGKLSKGPRGIVQGGVVMPRSPPPSANGGSPEQRDLPLVVGPGKIRPLTNSTLLTTKPVFAWPALPKAKKYTLHLYFLGNRIWTAESQDARLEYGGDAPLKSGAMYSWEVTTTIDGKRATVCEGMFRTASDRQQAEAGDLQRLLAKPDAVSLALAAMWYKQNGLVTEAIAANEQLAKLSPDPAIYRELVGLYFQAGREKDADSAEAKAAELEKKAEDRQQ